MKNFRVKEDFPEIKLTPSSLAVLQQRYLLKNDKGEPVEGPQDMFWRVAKNIAEAEELFSKGFHKEKTASDFYQLMTSLAFLPNSPTLMNAGRSLQQLSACFVLPVGDSIESIFEAVKNTAIIHKSGGGTGFSFSRIRPKDYRVSTSLGRASGPLSFMKVFNEATDAINQGGFRRGANMGLLRVDHPDIMNFILMKDKEGAMRNFNISVGLTDSFMAALRRNGKFPLRDPRTGGEVQRLPAREVFDSITVQAWKNGEPGIIFVDTINRQNPTPALGEMEGTNPCGEQPLLPLESCNLGSINLSLMERKGEVDFKKLKRIVHTGVHFLDNVIEVNRYPLEGIKRITLGNRKIGLGVMGFADLLIRLKIPYDSPKAQRLAGEIMGFIQKESKVMSVRLARLRGSFSNFRKSIYPKLGFRALRNATTTTIAPTGSLSIIAGCSSGIEPLFSVVYTREIMDHTLLPEVHPLFESHARESGFYSKSLLARIARKGSVQNFEEIPKAFRRIFRTAFDISPERHVRIQAAFQAFTDNAVSKTINFPRDSRPEDVRRAFLLAYRLGCKGVTVYRDGTRRGQALLRIFDP